MNKALIALAVALAAGRDKQVAEAACDPASRAEGTKFIVECARAANPMSDEEGEDLVRQCEWTWMRMCPKVPGFNDSFAPRTYARPCTEASTQAQRKACGR